MRALAFVILFCALARGACAAGADYAAVDAIFSRHCLDCHSGTDPDAKLVLESFDATMKGGEHGVVVVPGKSSASILVEIVEGTLLRDGKQLIMPPGRKRAKLKAAEIATIKAWIDSGARGPATTTQTIAELDVPKIAVKGTARNPVNFLVRAPGTNLIALGRYRTVELRSGQSGEIVRVLSGLHGNVNAVAFSPDGKKLFAGSGEEARFGEIKEWNVADGKLLRTFTGHKDMIYAVAVSPDGMTLASGSYDQKIKLWDVATGKELRTLSGHNGCIYGLSFRPDGKILASASGDHTVKLWDVATGQRRDTLSQPLKEIFAVAFSPDGTRLVAGGADNRIRTWQISPTATETTDTLLDSKFAAEGAILRLAYSPDGKFLLSSADDRTVRLWDVFHMKEVASVEKQSDWATGLDFVGDNKRFAVGRMDGSIGFYDFSGKPVKLAMTTPAPAGPKKMKGKSKKPPPSDKPEISVLEPRGLRRGTEITVKVTGVNLLDLTAVNSGSPKLKVTLTNQSMASATQLWLHVKAAADLAQSGYDISFSNEKGTGAPAKLFVGDLPTAYEPEGNKTRATETVSLPVSYWGTLNPGGDMDELQFAARAGQELVFDLAASRLGSKAQGHLTLLDNAGHILASQGEFDGGDPLLAWNVASNGNYKIQVTEETDAGSPEFFYRLNIGELPEVVSIFPPTVQTNRKAEVQLIGYNLAGKDRIWITPMKAGELNVPLDPEKYRFRKVFKVRVIDDPVVVESETNDTPAQANRISVPAVICGRIDWAGDADLFRFDAKAGEKMILETDAARLGSPVDTKIEVLWTNGNPVERLQLQAVRDTAINFRGIDSAFTEIRLDNWQEMQLNQYLYMEGEVCRFFRAPRGPDSGYEVYSSAGKRRDYFDTSATDHALDLPCYIVEPHPPGEQLTPNGLPVFPIYYENDDDGDRQLGADSRLHFTAPATGSYLARVTDNRNRGGPRFFYELTVRDARPDFTVALNGGSPTLSPGTGREFTLTANRIDGFDDDIRVDITGVPAGFRVSTPIVIQAGHSSASGTINCDTNAMTPKPEDVAKIEVTASAARDGKEMVMAVNSFDKITVGGPAKLLVDCEPYDAGATNFTLRPASAEPLEVTLEPGKTAPLWIKIRRQGHDDLVTFTGENLPHGVIIDNIGLNGVLIPKEESIRQIFLSCEKWVPDIDRLFYIKAVQAGEPTSLPVLLHVRHSRAAQTASAAP